MDLELSGKPALVTCLRGPRADFINGQNLRVDGGAH